MKSESRDARTLHEGRSLVYARVSDHHKKFIDEETGAFDEKYVRYRTCPVCDSRDHYQLLVKSGGTYVRCKNCSMIFTNPVFTDSALQDYYTALDTGQGAITQNEAPFYREIYSLGLGRIAEQTPAGALLDVGCSTGFFLDIARENGWKTHGLELGESEADECRRKGHVLYTAPLDTLSLGATFDVITLWDVFEHIPNGCEYLELLKKPLRPGGILFLQIPNSDSIAAKVMRDHCNMFDGLEHVNLYNPRTIARLATSCGYSIQSLQTVVSETAVINNYLSYDDPYFGESAYDNERGVLGLLDETFVHQNLLGYKMQIILAR